MLHLRYCALRRGTSFAQVGYSGATLVYANSGSTDNVKTDAMKQLKIDFKNCR